MMVDSIAMGVDAFTYLFNLIAEQLKHRHHKFHYNTHMNDTELIHQNDTTLQKKLRNSSKWKMNEKNENYQDYTLNSYHVYYSPPRLLSIESSTITY